LDTKKQQKQTDEAKQNQLTVNIEHLRNNVKLMIGTPMYGGQATEAYFRSCLKLNTFFSRHGINLAWCTIANESLVQRARNVICNSFLSSDYTHLMFIDADIGFEVESVLKLLLADKSVCGGSYPKKGLNWTAIAKAAKDGVEPNQLPFYGAQYAMNFLFEDPVKKTIKLSNGMAKVHDLATGFMLIKRHVFEDMMTHYPELEYKNDLDLGKREFNRWFAFFDCGVERNEDGSFGVYNSEDYRFCRQWQKMGGDIWLDPFIKLDHFGHFRFSGNPETILGLPEPTGE